MVVNVWFSDLSRPRLTPANAAEDIHVNGVILRDISSRRNNRVPVSLFVSRGGY